MLPTLLHIFIGVLFLLLTGCNGIDSKPDAAETSPPKRYHAAPSGTLPSGTTRVSLSLQTDKNATCHYDTAADIRYEQQKYVFQMTGTREHRQTVSGLKEGKQYTYYVRCSDAEGHANRDDWLIAFSIEKRGTMPPPPSPPKISGLRPMGTLPAGTSSAVLSLTTDQKAICRYDTQAGVAYDEMQQTFTETGMLSHRSTVSGLRDGTVYRYFVRCKSDAGGVNGEDSNITFSVAGSGGTSVGGFVVDHTMTDLSRIPDAWIAKAKETLHIAYNHTSHGSQLITGMNALKDYPLFGNKYAWRDTTGGDTDSLSLDDRGMPSPLDLSQGDKDSDGDGIADWAETTYAYLEDTSHYHVNVIMWSWCNISGHDIDRYLRSMEWLIGQFGAGGTHPRAEEHPVKFVFMTAHANGGGEYDSSDTPNRQIRQYVAAHGHILFDFSDIENYDPDNNYFLDKRLNDTLNYDRTPPYDSGSRDANWAGEYLVRHDGGELDKLTHGEGVAGYSGAGSCAHSNAHDNDARLNCVLKGRGAWYLFARLAGWSGY